MHPDPSPRRSPVPQTLLELLGSLLRSTLLALPRGLITAIPLMVVIFLLHAFLLVAANEGFNLGTNPILNSFLVVPNNPLPGTLFWFLVGLLLAQIRNQQLGVLFQAIGRLPSAIGQTLQADRQAALALWLGAATALLITIPLGNLLVCLQLMLFTAVALVQPNHLLALAIRLGWADSQRIWRGQPNFFPLPSLTIQGLIAGLTLGFGVSLAAYVIPLPIRMAAIATTVLLALLQFRSPGNPGNGVSLLLLGAIGLTLFYALPAYADDCGLREAGGLLPWLLSPCPFVATPLSLPSALSFPAGFIFGTLPPVSNPLVIYGSGTPEDPFRDYPDANHPPWMEGVYGTGTVNDPYRDYEPLPPDLNQPIDDGSEVDGTEDSFLPPDDGSSSVGTDDSLFPPDDAADSGETDNSLFPPDNSADPGTTDDAADSGDWDFPEPPEDEPEAPEDESEEPEQPEPSSVTPEQLQQLQDKFQEMVEQKLKEGYYVKNPGLISKAWNWTLGGAGKWLAGYKGGQCGEFGQWGMEWSKEFVEKTFGQSAIVDDVTILEKSTIDPSGVLDTLDSVVDINHRATRVILPTGERYVLDYWEAMGRSGGKAKLVPEKEWIDKWTKAVGENDAYPDTRSNLQQSLKISLQQAQSRGIDPEKVFEKFRKENPAQADTIINSWKKEPW